MKEIKIVCNDTGKARVTSNDTNISNENKATNLILDFSETTYKALNKWVDIVLSNGTSIRYDLGMDEVITKALEYLVTIPGEIIITPFIYDGDVKIKYIPNRTVIMYYQPEAGDPEAPARDDYIFELAARIDDLDGQGTGSKGFLFDITNPKTSEQLAIGEMAWDLDHKTLQIRLTEDVYMQIGQEQPYPFRNALSEELAEGTPMYVSGVVGASHQIEISPLSNDNYENCKRFIGLLTEPMLANAIAFTTMLGAVHNVSAGALGSVLYVGDKVCTDVEPIPPLNKVIVGMQGQVDTHAVIFVKPDIRKNLEDLNNVLMAALAVGDVPYWMGTHFIKHNLGPQWTDLTRQMTPSTVGKNLKPDFDDVNIGLLFPRNDTSELVYTAFQFPHGYKEGSDVEPHIHMAQAYDLQAVFKIDYVWVNIGEAIGAWTTLTLDTYLIEYAGSPIHQILKASAHIDGTGKKISSILKIKLYRDDDVYTGDVLVSDLDVHYQKDAFGSIQEYTKQ